MWSSQGLVKGVILCFRKLYFYFQHGETTSTASQLPSPASQNSKNLNKVPLLLQDLGSTMKIPHPLMARQKSSINIRYVVLLECMWSPMKIPLFSKSFC